MVSQKATLGKRYFVEVDVQYPTKLHDLIYHFCLKERQLKKLKSLQRTCAIKKHQINIINLKQALNHGLVLNQKSWLKPQIDKNTELKKVRNNFEKYFLKLVNNSDFGKTTENV